MRDHSQRDLQEEDRVSRSFRHLCLFLSLILTAVITPAGPVLAASYTVTSTANDSDSNTSDGVCQTASGVCTLRAAIQQANATAGSHTISFNIPTSDSGYNASLGVWTISVSSTRLPAISVGNVTIDGTTQPNGRTTGPKIEIDGSAFASAGVLAGLELSSSNNTVRGLIINSFPLGFLSIGGIGIYVNGDAADSNQIVGNWIGVDADGTTGAGNTFAGIYVLSGDTNTIRGNVISDNGETSGTSGANVIIGRYTDSAAANVADGNIVAGNYIGSNSSGTATIGGGNTQDGVVIANRVTNTVIGGSTTADRNIIVGHSSQSGFSRAGVRIQGNGNSNNTVRGNYIGVAVNGTTGLGNAYGVLVRNDVDAATIDGNTISSSVVHGVLIEPTLASVSGVTISNNTIGLNAAGAALGNTSAGIALLRSGSNAVGVSDVTIRGNTISANGTYGIQVGSSSQAGTLYTSITIAGNRIGTSADGNSTSTSLLNGQTGVLFSTGQSNTIGGSVAADRNVIVARAAQAAIRLTSANTTNITVAGNYIGVGSDGSTALLSGANRADVGILVDTSSGSHIIGPGNVVSANNSGIQLSGGSGSTIIGNTVGFAADGTTDRGNTQFGVWILNSTNNTIGGSSAGNGNLIGGNDLRGVYLDGTSSGNQVLGNTIRANTEDGLFINSSGTNGTIVRDNTLSNNGRDGIRITTATGVELTRNTTTGNTGSGITLLSGANNSRSAPTINASLGTGGSGEPLATGTVSSCVGCTVEIFSSASREDGEGPRYIASGTVQSNGSFSIDVSGCDRYLTATVRDGTNNTSAFTTPMVDTTVGCSAAQPTLSAGTPASSNVSPVAATAGGTVVFQHTLTNTGGLGGTFSLSATSSPQGWAASVNPASVTLAAGANTTIEVTVMVPANAVGGQVEATTVTATAGSQSDSEINYARVGQTFGVNIEPPRSVQFTASASPVDVDFTHTITNTGNGADTITINAVNTSIAGSPTFSYPNGTQCVNLAAGAACTRTVRVTLPGGSTGGTFTVTATGGGGSSDSVVDTAFTLSVIPVLSSNVQRDAFPGATVIFTHTLSNGGNTIGDFTPSLIQPNPLDGWSYALEPTGTFSLAPSASRVLTVTATVASSGTGAISDTVKTAVLQVLASSGAQATANDAVRVRLQPSVTLSAASVPSVNALPLATVVFTHTLTNTANGNDSYTIVLTPTAGLENLSVTPASPVAVARGGNTQIVVRAQVKSGTDVGTESVQVQARSVAAPTTFSAIQTDTVNVTGAAVPSLSVTPSTRSVNPAGVVTFTYTLTNTGNQDGTFSAPSFTLPSGWVATPQTPPSCITGGSLARGTGCSFDVQITTTSGAFAGDYPVRAQVSSVTTPTAPVASVLATVTINPIPSLTFTANQSSSTGPGDPVVYSHTLVNTGNVTDTISFNATIAVGWLVTTPAPQVLVPPGATRTISVTVTPPSVVTAGAGAVATITATSGTSPNPSAQVQDTTTILAVDRASLTPAAQTVSGTAGDTVNFFPVLRNTGSTAIAYTVSIVSAAWPTTIVPTQTVTLLPGATVPLTLSVQIPSTAGINADNLINVNVFKQGAAVPILANGQYTATTRLVGSLLEPVENTRTVLPGTTTVYTHTLTNITSVEDTFTLRTIATNGWNVEVAPASIFLEPGQSAVVEVRVSVPRGQSLNRLDYSYVEVQSLRDPSLNALGTEVTTVGRLVAAQLSPDQGVNGTAGTTVVFQHTLVNEGNGLDTFAITAQSQAGWMVNLTVPPSGSVSLQAGRSFPIEIEVVIPAGAPNDFIDRITVRATSQTNMSVSAEVVNTIIMPPDTQGTGNQHTVALPVVIR